MIFLGFLCATANRITQYSLQESVPSGTSWDVPWKRSKFYAFEDFSLHAIVVTGDPRDSTERVICAGTLTTLPSLGDLKPSTQGRAEKRLLGASRIWYANIPTLLKSQFSLQHGGKIG